MSDHINNKIIEYFRSLFGADSVIATEISQQSLESNVDQLLTRDRNLLNRTAELIEFENQCRQTKAEAYEQAYKDCLNQIKTEMTKQEALKVLGTLTLNDIVDLGQEP